MLLVRYLEIGILACFLMLKWKVNMPVTKCYHNILYLMVKTSSKQIARQSFSLEDDLFLCGVRNSKNSFILKK